LLFSVGGGTGTEESAMSGFGCCFWWLVFGALLGWLASWALGRVFAKEVTVAPLPVRSSDGIDYAAARAAGFVLSGPDNLEIIEGIGPVIANLMRANGIGTFAKLAGTPASTVQASLDRGGARFRTANPGTWAEQAGLAAANRWAELRAMQDALDAGMRR
jgi:predicted flap endonuclease-1-like 5' DNA nuclease